MGRLFHSFFPNRSNLPKILFLFPIMSKSAPPELFLGWLKSNLSEQCEPCNGPCYHPINLYEPILCDQPGSESTDWTSPTFLLALLISAFLLQSLFVFLLIRVLHRHYHRSRPVVRPALPPDEIVPFDELAGLPPYRVSAVWCVSVPNKKPPKQFHPLENGPIVCSTFCLMDVLSDPNLYLFYISDRSIC